MTIIHHTINFSWIALQETMHGRITEINGISIILLLSDLSGDHTIHIQSLAVINASNDGVQQGRSHGQVNHLQVAILFISLIFHFKKNNSIN